MRPRALRRPFSCSRARVRLRQESGTTLVELLVVLSIMTVVLLPLVTGFTTSLSHEARTARLEQAYSNARTALQRMRLDVHCAHAVTGVEKNTFGGFTLTLSESHEGENGWCPGVIPAGATTTGVQWCTIPDLAVPTRFKLYRFLGVGASICDGGSQSTFEVGFLSMPPGGWPANTDLSMIVNSSVPWDGNIWPTPAICNPGTLRTLTVDLNVALDPAKYPKERYELRDSLNLRNANRCA